MQKKDSTTLGVFVGLLLPLILLSSFILYSSPKFGSIVACIEHFQNFNILYKALSVSLMPGAGLFFMWSHQNKLNQARGVLMMSLFYGVIVLLLYMM
jgi:hypothetical protein